MDLAGWDEQYRKNADSVTERVSVPNPLIVNATRDLSPGRALDLACGTGRNAIWLAHQGWSVTAVDGSAAAVESLRARATDLSIETHIADLENNTFTIEPTRYDLIAMCYYFERRLIDPCKHGLVPGGIMVMIALLMEPGKEHSTFRLQPGELRTYFTDWEILHYRECTDPWQHKVAELVTRRSMNDLLKRAHRGRSTASC
jgi:tellurite methyltransferase